MMASEPIDALAHMRQSNLERVYQIKIPLESYWELAESHLNDQGFDADNIPSELREQLWRGACGSTLFTINSLLANNTLAAEYGYGVEYTMALLNTFQLSNAFASQELEEDAAYLYLFEDVAVMVAFTKMEGGLVTAAAAPVFADEILGASRSGLRRLLEDFYGGEYEFEVEEITP